VTRALLDTDVLIDHLRGSRRLELSEAVPLPFISVVTRCELFAGQDVDEAALRALLAGFEEVAIDRAIAERGGRIRRETGISLPDALIAASALEHGLAVLTRNRRHFERVTGLEVSGPDVA
jgi:predicted nucleic acid-binding protein